jgi:hypothetical protein
MDSVKPAGGSVMVAATEAVEAGTNWPAADRENKKNKRARIGKETT